MQLEVIHCWLLRSLYLGMVLCGLALAGSAKAADLKLIHARVFSAPGAAPLEDATIVVHDRRIVSVSNAARLRADAATDGQILDCTGLSVTAGFWNSHVHILPVKLLHARLKTAQQLTAALQEMLTQWGFTTVFDIASILDNSTLIRTRIEAGTVLGPRILTTGEPFFPRHGVPSYVKDYLVQNHIVLPDDATIGEAVARVRREVQQGADGIKIFAGAIEGDDVLLMPLDRAKAIALEAHRLHRPVFAHPSNLKGIEIAIDSGVDVLAHVTSNGGPWPPALVERMRASSMALTPTLSLFDVEATKAGASRENAEKVVDRAVAALRAYVIAGGEILFGTDVGYIDQFDTAEEFTLMQRAGMDFPQILASLTTNPARRFGFAKRSGLIAKDMDADLTVFEGDPATDITALSRVHYTIREGRVIYAILNRRDAALTICPPIAGKNESCVN